MRYGEPSIASAMMTYGKKVERVLIIPMYPQYFGDDHGIGFDSRGDHLQRFETCLNCAG